MEDMYLVHSFKGTTWSKHKYIKKIDGRYYYATKNELKEIDRVAQDQNYYQTLYDESSNAANKYNKLADNYLNTSNKRATSAKANYYLYRTTAKPANLVYKKLYEYNKNSALENKANSVTYREKAEQYLKKSDAYNKKISALSNYQDQKALYTQLKALLKKVFN